MPDEPIPAVAPTTLPRVLGLFDATMMVVGSIIGSGIFLKVGNVDKALQAYGFIPILSVWVGVGIVTLCGSLALAELGAMYPQAGGPYLYLREAYGRLPAFLWGWTEFWVVRTGSVGALACATVIYFTELVPMDIWAQGVLATIIVIGLSLTNMFSTRWGASVQNVATVAKVTFLGLILLPFLLNKIEPANLQPMWASGPADDASSLTFWKMIGIAMVAVMWPYDGWINLGPVAEEIREPQRNVPLAFMFGLGTVIVVYIGAILSYHLVLTTGHLAESETVASDLFRALFNSTGAKIAALGVMCSTFGATNSNMITGPRIYFAVARDGLVPRWIQQIHPTRQTPANSILIQAVWTSILIAWFTYQTMFPRVATPTAEVQDQVSKSAVAQESNQKAKVIIPEKPKSLREAFDGMTDSVICAGLIFYSLAVAAVYVLRFTKPDLPRPYKTWGYPFTPALLLIAYAGVLGSQLWNDWKDVFDPKGVPAPGATNTTAVFVLIAAGALYYWWASSKWGFSRVEAERS
jgi:APA family basic amino acid/polyamine antiporter